VKISLEENKALIEVRELENKFQGDMSYLGVLKRYTSGSIQSWEGCRAQLA
jgi:hypothetical protein